jgi:hypothetical protein
MNCPYKHCESTDTRQLFVADGARLIYNFYGTVKTTYCKCHNCGKYFKHVSFCAPLGSTEKREAMMAEIREMATVREHNLAASRAN